MNLAFKKIQARISFTEIGYLIFFISLVCAFRAITCISIVLLVIAGMIEKRFTLRTLLSRHPANEFALLCSLFLLLQIFSLVYTHNMQAGWTDLQLKSGLVFLPFAVICTGPLKREVIEKLLWYYCIVLLMASMFLLCRASIECLRTGTITPLFYHALVSPFGYHAVYFSILVFVALAFLVEIFISGENISNRTVLIFLICFFSFVLLLLASKLILSFYLFYLIYCLMVRAGSDKAIRLISYSTILLIVSISTILVVTRNPIGYRFRDVVHGNISLISQDEFSPAVYFNGLQFRMLEWKLVPEILNEKHRWWTGVGGGDAQDILDQKYLSKHMYAGTKKMPGHPVIRSYETVERGYLGYNTHSQLLESLLQNGIPGLVVFILICFCLLKMMWQTHRTMVKFIILLLVIYSVVESVFQQQYGIVIFTFFPIFMNQVNFKRTTSGSITQNQLHYQ